MVFHSLAGIASRAAPFLGRLGSGLIKGIGKFGGILGKGLGAISNFVKGGRLSSALSRGASIAGKVGKGLGTAGSVGTTVLGALDLAKQSGLVPQETSERIGSNVSKAIAGSKVLQGASADIGKGLSSASGIFA